MLTLETTAPPPMATESDPHSADQELQPPVAVLLAAALRGLLTVPPEGEQPKELERSLESLDTLNPESLRRLAADRLLAGMDHDLAEGTFYRKGRKFVRDGWSDLDDPDEHCHEAYVFLREVVERYVAAIGHYRGREPKKLFPVESSYRGWVDSYIAKSVLKSFELHALEKPLDDDEDISEASDATDVTPSLRRFVPAMVQRVVQASSLSPDLQAALTGGRPSSKVRAKVAPSAAIQAINLVAYDAVTQDFTDPERLASDVLTAQVVPLIPTVSQREKFVSRHVADVIFAVTDAMGAAGDVRVLDQTVEILAHYFAGARQLWRAAQLRAVVALLSDAMVGEIGGSRVIAIVRWIDDLELWLFDASTPDAILGAVRRASDACESASHGSAASPLARARELLADSPNHGAKRQAAEALASFANALRQFIGTRGAT